MSNMGTSGKKLSCILQFFFDKTSHSAEDVGSAYGSPALTVNLAHFWSRRFRSRNFDVKYAPGIETSIK